MTKRVFSAALTCGLLVVLAGATAYAQLPGTTLRATIPFDFSIRGKILPAGTYEIRRALDTPDDLMILSLNDKHEHAIFETESVQARETLRRGQLVFHRYGDSYFLSEVFAGGDNLGRELVPSPQERKLKRELASNKTQPETVSLAVY